jgi:Flp pilus assembly protein protease CpaA
MENITTSIIRLFTNVPEIILLNIFFIIATYTDCKSYKIYDRFNIVMLITRVIYFIVLFIFFPEDVSLLYVLSCIGGAVVMFLSFLIPAMITMDSIGGDIKFAANIGLWTGSIPALFLTLIASITNFLYRILFVRNNKKNFYLKNVGNIYIPFKAAPVLPLAPFIYLGYICLAVFYVLYIK